MELEYNKTAGASRHRQKIICAAKRVFYVKGYKKATIKDIAREAGIRSEVIYQLFRNKQELYASLSMSTLQYLNIRLSDLSSRRQEHSLEGKMAAVKDAFCNIYEFESHGLKWISRAPMGKAFRSLSPELAAQVDRQHSRLIQHLADIFYDTAQGTIRPKLSSKDLAVEVLGKFFGIIQQEPDPQSTSGKYYHSKVETKLETAFNLIVRRLNNCEVQHE